MNEGVELDREEALFLSIMYSFHAAAMQQMGKIANPLTGKVERDLAGARGAIDVLLLFQKKTQGNLTDRERRVLNNLITELQLNYIDESQRAPEAAAEEAEAAAAAGPEPAGEPGAATSPEGKAAPPPEALATEETPPAAEAEKAGEPGGPAAEKGEPEAAAEEVPPPKAKPKKKKKKAAGSEKQKKE